MPRLHLKMPQRFWARVPNADDPEACWIWAGAIGSNGYGRIRIDDRIDYAHRVALALVGVDIPKGFHVDHLCETKACVNPAHLEPVTPSENLLRSSRAS